MKKSEFQKIEERYFKERGRFQKIKKGDLVWEVVPRGGDIDYHPAVVTSINIDESHVDVIDVSDNDKEKRYEGFLTESEFLERGFSKEGIQEEYKKYEGIIKKVLS